MNKISLFLAGVSLTSSLLATELDSFKKGFTIGLEAVEYQLKNEGYEPKIMQLDSPYIVVMDIKNIPTNDILYFQHLLAKDSINSLITKNFLLIKSFDRIADANELKKSLQSKYSVELKVQELTTGTIETYPILFSRTFDKVITDVTTNYDIKYVKQYETPLQIRLENKNKPKKKKVYRTFRLKNTAMAYTYKYDQDSDLQCGNTKGKCFDSSLFDEKKVYTKGRYYRKGGVYRTSDGELFQKVYNTNLFFDLNDVRK